MRKIISLLLSFLLLFSVCSISAFASDEDSLFYEYMGRPKIVSGDYSYFSMGETLLYDLIAIEEYSGDAERLEIPRVLDGQRVAGIAWYAIRDCEHLKELIFPDGLVVIDFWAIYGCPNLETVKFQEGIKDLDMYFGDCPKLRSVSVPNSVQNIYGYDLEADLTFVVGRGSYAEEFCKINGIAYQYDPQVWVRSYDWDLFGKLKYDFPFLVNKNAFSGYSIHGEGAQDDLRAFIEIGNGDGIEIKLYENERKILKNIRLKPSYYTVIVSTENGKKMKTTGITWMNEDSITISEYENIDDYQFIIDALSCGGNTKFEIIPQGQESQRYVFTADCYYSGEESLVEELDSLRKD